VLPLETGLRDVTDPTDEQSLNAVIAEFARRYTNC
jgi:hypothetical protein